MKTGIISFFIFFFLSGFSVSADSSELNCDGPEFTEKDIVEIVQRERKIRPNLPEKIYDAEVFVHRKRCHYVYVEYPKNKTVGKNRVFVLNKYGVIVDAKAGRAKKNYMKCPVVEYTIDDLAGFLKRSRLSQEDLPKELTKYEARFSKMRCSYVYYETYKSDLNNTYQSFTIDYYGDVYDYYVE